MTQLDEYRLQKDLFFETNNHSPLTLEQKSDFLGLSYFPENPDLTFNLKIVQFDIKENIKMQTSTGDVQDYIREGKIHFEVRGKRYSLTVFKSNHGYFIPFVDANAGKLTYGAGRYLDPQILDDDTLLIDFNHAYNPYCAYNENFSCPLPPLENKLSAVIEAGEQNYK